MIFLVLFLILIPDCSQLHCYAVSSSSLLLSYTLQNASSGRQGNILGLRKQAGKMSGKLAVGNVLGEIPSPNTTDRLCSYTWRNAVHFINLPRKFTYRYSLSFADVIMMSLTEADLGMFSMFGRTGAPQKWGPHMRTKNISATCQHTEIARKSLK